MSDKKYADDDPERTLVTLDQLSQTIEVMTSVVNRLRRHLSDQIKGQLESQDDDSPVEAAAQANKTEANAELLEKAKNKKRESFVVEISQQEIEPIRKSTKVLH
jgi:hypothetical protein